MTPTLRGWLRALVLLALGALVGGLFIGRLSYERPGRSVVNSYLVRLGLRQGRFDAYGYDPALYGGTTSSEDWSGVRSLAHPQWKVRRGLEIAHVASGFNYPVNIAFTSKASDDPHAPSFYVTELHGTVKVVTRSGEVHTYAEGLINFEPDESHFSVALSDERGIVGICAVPGSEDLLVTGSYREDSSGLLKNHVLRLISEPGGLSMQRSEVLLDIPEYTSPSHQIQGLAVAPDGTLLVSVGDGQNYRNSLDLSRYGGKLLRCNLDGSPCEDNPYYDPLDADAPRGYVYSYGLRNVFDFDFDPASGDVYAVDNGYDIDRLLRAIPGANYAWNGQPDSTRTNALFVWGGSELMNTSPTGVTFLRGNVLGDSTVGKLAVCLFSPYARQAKAIVEFGVVPDHGLLDGPPAYLLQYVGDTKASVLGVAEGPDGVYFTDFWGETNASAQGQGNVWRLFASDSTLGLSDVDEEMLSSLEPRERGEIHFRKNCINCHRIDDVGGREGPDLSGAGSVLEQRLSSKAYDATLAEFLSSDASFYVTQRPRLERVSAAAGEERVRIWLSEHLDEPRFDNPNARMPAFVLSPEEKVDLIDYLVTLKK